MTLEEKAIAKKSSIKILGVTLNSTLTWDKHVQLLLNKIRPMARALLRSIKYMDLDTKKILYNAAIASRLNYCDTVWHSCGSNLTGKLQTIQNMIARDLLGANKEDNTHKMLETLGWLPLKTKRKVHIAVQMFKIINDEAPKQLVCRTSGANHSFNTRSKNGNNQY